MTRRVFDAALLVAATAALALALHASVAPAAGTVACPASAAAAGPVQWAFSVIGAPRSSDTAIRTSWTRGNGTWNARRAHGTICMDDQGGGAPKSRIVLSATGSSTLSPGVRKFGLKGVGIVIHVRVAATDDAGCSQGARGSVTLFASYYSIHRDSIATRFGAACSDHDLTFHGAIVKVEISRNGAQVNSA